MIKCKLSPRALGLAFGVVWGASALLAGLAAYFFSYGKPFVEAMSAIYLGYEPSIPGSILGGLFGFINGLIFGVLIACFYNCFAMKCCCSSSQSGMAEDESCCMPTQPMRAAKKSTKPAKKSKK